MTGAARKTNDTARWDGIVKDVSEVVGDLARLTAAATGAPEVVTQLREAARHAARAAILALPRTRCGSTPSR